MVATFRLSALAAQRAPVAALVLGLLCSSPAMASPKAAASGAKTAEPSRWTVFPILGHQPETSWFFGGFVDFHYASPGAAANAPPPRRSSVSLAALYSLKAQFMVALEPTLYLAGGQYRVKGSLSAAEFPDVFYAPGPRSPASSREPYEQRLLGVRAVGEWCGVDALFVGWQVQTVVSTMTAREPGGELASGRIPGSAGGVVVGSGPMLTWDDRDREGSPRRGGHYELSFINYPSWLGSDFGTSALSFDLTKYVGLFAGSVLAVQLYSRHAGGSVPFQLLSSLAGNGRMRGFLTSRYVDRHAVTAQVEWRMPLFWRFGAVAFLGAGQVARRLGELDLARPKVAGGPGLRLALNPEDGVNVRLDFGVSSDGDQNVYVLLGDAF